MCRGGSCSERLENFGYGLSEHAQLPLASVTERGQAGGEAACPYPFGEVFQKGGAESWPRFTLREMAEGVQHDVRRD